MNERAADISQQVGTGFSSFAARIPEILADPRAYPREAMLLAAIVGLAILLIVLVGVVVVDVFASSSRRRRLNVSRKGRWAPIGVILGIVGVLLVILSVAPNTVAVSHQCDVCHELDEPVAAWEKDVHAEVACYSCHASDGLSGSMQASAREAFRPLAADDARAAVPVYEERCLECHEEITDEIVGQTVRMRHEDVIDAGYSCSTCHFETGHAGLAESRGENPHQRPVMTQCLTCHDGVEVSAECDLCHDGRPSDTAGLAPAGDTPVRIQCQGCHTPETDAACIDCHGLILPHPPEFPSEHAGRAWNEPDLCRRCHETTRTDGCYCHDDENVHGTYSDWFPKHGPAARDNWPGGCNCHEVSDCGYCHTTSPF